MFNRLSLSHTAPNSPRRIGLGFCLMAASLLTTAAAPAWAIPKYIDAVPCKNTALAENQTEVIHAIAPFLASPALSNLAQENYAEVIRAIEAYPEVVVFPIQVAGPVTATAARRLANKIAQASVAGSIAVIYPDIGEPYRSVFAQIINGIEEKAKGLFPISQLARMWMSAS